MAGSIIVMDSASATSDPNSIEFDVINGTFYLWCMVAALTRCATCPFICFPYKYMTSQDLQITDSKLIFKTDWWCVRKERMVPLDRIQDVVIIENCFQRCCSIANLEVSTAGGGKMAEITLIAPRNPLQLRDRIIAARDAFEYRNQHQHQAAASSAANTSLPLSPLLLPPLSMSRTDIPSASASASDSYMQVDESMLPLLVDKSVSAADIDLHSISSWNDTIMRMEAKINAISCCSPLSPAAAAAGSSPSI